MKNSKVKGLVIGVVLVVGIVFIGGIFAFNGGLVQSGFDSNDATGGVEMHYSCSIGDFAFENSHLPAVSICIEDYGVIVAELYPEYAPITVENFINLVDDGFYDGLTLHRIIEGFMMQGGDPLGTGMGNSGHFITGEFSSNGWDNPIAHVRGVLSMARLGHDPNSASSQFFIIDGEAWWLDGDFAGFGRVIYGIEVVDRITANSNPTDDNGTIRPEEQPVIHSIRMWNRPN